MHGPHAWSHKARIVMTDVSIASALCHSHGTTYRRYYIYTHNPACPSAWYDVPTNVPIKRTLTDVVVHVARLHLADHRNVG
jgi:hypothetical protein